MGTMASRFAVGDPVRTPLGRGVVGGIRRRGRVVVELKGRAVELDEDAVSPLDVSRTSKRKSRSFPQAAAPGFTHASERSAAVVVDLHGLTVDEAITRVERTVNDALLADAAELRLIHGRGGGRIRGAVHRWLRDTPAVRGFRLDPGNAGVTIVIF